MSILQAWVLFAYYNQLSASELKKVLKNWKSSNEQISETLIGYQTFLKRLDKEWDSFMAYECSERIAIEIEGLLPGLGRTENHNILTQVYITLPIHSMQDIQIDGFGVKEALKLEKMGPKIGKVLQAVEKAILSDELKNENHEIVDWIRNHFLEN